MPNDLPHIVKETVELTVATTGYSATGTLSDKFGREGKILGVLVREDGTLNKATSAACIITDTEAGDIDAETVDGDIVYASSATAFAGSDTVAELNEGDAVFGSAPYCMEVDENLKIAVNVIAAAGGGASSKFYATVKAEVYR